MEEITRSTVPIKINGATAYFEVSVVDDTLENAEEQVASLAESLNFAQVEKAIQGVAQMLANALDAVKPTKVGAEFGIEFGIDAGGLIAVFVRGSGKANLKISLEWAHQTN
jgi:hypothetical protein